MYPLSITSILSLTAGVIGLELAFFAFLLVRRNLFRWATSGFWAWSAFLVYFVLAPFAITFNDNALYNAQIRMAYSGGADRGLWILLMAFLGVAIFFSTYLRTKYKVITWRLSAGEQKITPPMALVTVIFMAFGVYSLLVFRAGLVSGGDTLIVGSRFQGSVTGYQYAGHVFLFVPIMLLSLSKDFVLRFIGWIFLIGFLVLSLPHAWFRYVTVSMVVAFSLLTVFQKKRRWPSLVWLFSLLSVVVAFQLRGHVEWDYDRIGRETTQLFGELPQKSAQILSSNDTAMLPTWYVSSFFYDTWVGHDYGLSLLNYVLFGWIPNRIFPQKYFIIDWLRIQQGSVHYPLVLDRFLYGAKSSLLGSFYAHGGWVGILIGTILAGYLSRRLDGMLAEDAPVLVKSVAISWLSVLWMVWGSGTNWGVMILGAMAMPALAIWLVLPKEEMRHLSGANEVLPHEYQRGDLSNEHHTP